MLAAIAKTAARLCEANDAVILLVEGDQSRLAARHGRLGVPRKLGEAMPLTFDMIGHRAIIECRTIHIRDLAKTPRTRFLKSKARLLPLGVRTVLTTPLLRDGVAIGAFVIRRTKVRPFTPKQIALLKTFADQAAIAIENARLSQALEARNRDLTEALEQQTATSEILRVISSSPTNIQPVLDTVVRAAAQFCGAENVAILRLDGGVLRGAATVGPFGDTVAVRLGSVEALEVPVTRGSVTGRAVVERRTVHSLDLAAEPEDEFPVGRDLQLQFGHGTLAATPLLREGVPLGVIALFRTEVKPFSDKQLALLRTFADQAVIAIENVRLFTELQARNSELRVALEQQTATSELLKVIGRSTFDLQPVFDTLAENGVRLCDAQRAFIFRFDGQLLRAVASYNASPELIAFVDQNPIPPGRQTGTARAALERRTIHIHDVLIDPEYTYAATQVADFRTVLGIPILRAGELLGVFMLFRDEVRPFADSQIALMETFADQAAIAIENARLLTELQAKNADLTEALEQQTATSEILRVISQSPTDVQPVFDIIGERAERLCAADLSVVSRFDGELIQLVALHGVAQEGEEAVRGAFPMRSSDETVTARAFRTCSVVHVPDVLADPLYETKGAARAGGYHGCLGVPMVREGQVIGVIFVARTTPGYFADTQVELLKTFADQAVIAIENVRLFTELEVRNNELTVALEQQTATSEILRVISSTPTDVQPVFDTIARSAMRLCDAAFSVVSRYDGELVHLAAEIHITAEGGEALRQQYPMRPGRSGLNGRVVLEGRVVNIPDVEADAEYSQSLREALRLRSALGVPILRDGRVIGAVAVGRMEVRSFTDNEIALLQTFAHQAVIAIENVRLFTELESRNSDLRVALEQQTATSEILRVISQSQTDVQPVFEAMAANALRLCDAKFSAIFRFDGELIHIAALHNVNPEGNDALRAAFPMPPSRGACTARAVMTRSIVAISDVREDPEYRLQGFAQSVDYHSVLSVPMLREGQPVGVISVGKAEATPFPDEQIELLKTFADQALIALENVRLFKELQARTGELTQSVEKLTALGEISQALSSTLDVETVLDTIVSHASQLAGGAGCAIYEYEEAAGQFELRATHGYEAAFVEALRAVPLRRGEGLMGRATEMREPIQIPDISQPGAYQSSLRDTLIRFGYRAILSVPLLREEQIIGSLSLTRKAPGEYSPEVIDVLKTFATQSALAIQNARLFREIADKSRQLEVASRHKSEFLANMSHELRTPLNAIIGFSEVLNERMFGELNPKQEEYLKDIHASGQHLLSLINDILDLSKVEAGRMELELTDFDLPAAMDNAVTLVRERASRKGVTVRIAVDEQVGAIRGDERKIRQVLLNLLSNAIKFTPEGGRIEVGAVQGDGAVEVSVSDTGVGIAPEDQEAVFEEFRQVGASAAKQEGTGLGLALCRKFIELHGGTIRVTSAIGAGSTFTFRLPQ
jgi:GAF domain-containing protein/anti-sigma regulatory factor (Ser/Thr protein kinase)